MRVGTPYVGSNRNYNLQIARNQIRDNGGTNLAGGIGLFTGSDGYQITGNAICGNFSAEYGGAISAFGYHANRRRNQRWRDHQEPDLVQLLLRRGRRHHDRRRTAGRRHHSSPRDPDR